METKVGDIYKSVLDGSDYIVKRIVNPMVVLKSQDGKKEIVTGVSSLNIKSFYQKKGGSEMLNCPRRDLKSTAALPSELLVRLKPNM